MSKVDEYLEKHELWREHLITLRKLLQKLPLEETTKWGGPCYSYEGKNLIGLGAFKNHLALWFHQGALLKDERQVLINAQEDKTRAMRQWRFTKEDKIPIATVRSYVKEAIEKQKLGLEIKPDRSKPLIIPEELTNYLKQHKLVGTAFGKLTPGKQREFADHISEAKRAETKTRRLETIKSMILAGTGLHDKYR